jgi:hypothetical protein
MSTGADHHVTTADRVGLGLATLIFAVGLTAVWAARTSPAQTPPPQQAVATAPGGSPATDPGPDLRQTTPLAQHQISFLLEPGKGIELKYRLDTGAGMVYEWSASGPVTFDFHGEAEEAPVATAETYRAGEGRTAAGVFVAPARGIHGWYWENAGETPVMVSLKTSGFYTAALEFRSTGTVEHPLQR